MREVPAPLSPVPLYFSSLSLLHTALHYLNAWNRLGVVSSGGRKREEPGNEEEAKATCGKKHVGVLFARGVECGLRSKKQR